MILHPLTILELGALGLFAGVLGALVGIGGGIVLIPTLVLAFGFDIKVAVATSLVAVVATSTAAGSVYVGKGLSNMRLGMTLEIATTLGGISGGLLAMVVSPQLLAVLFACMVLLTAYLMLRSKETHKPKPAPSDGSVAPIEAGSLEGNEEMGRIAGSYYDPIHRSLVHYEATRLSMGAAVSFVAGILSGMLGVGGGFIKVPAMNLGMKVPLKVAAATSNFMIGVTAISSLFVYFARGMVHPFIAAPVAIGIVIGAFAGTRLSHRTKHDTLKTILSIVLIVVAVQMFLKVFGVSLGK